LSLKLWFNTQMSERDRARERHGSETRTHLGEVQAASDANGQSFFADAQAEFGTVEERRAERESEENS